MLVTSSYFLWPVRSEKFILKTIEYHAIDSCWKILCYYDSDLQTRSAQIASKVCRSAGNHREGSADDACSCQGTLFQKVFDAFDSELSDWLRSVSSNDVAIDEIFPSVNSAFLQH